MTTRSEQKAKRRWEILDAALKLFIHRGFSGTKIQDIADAVPMSTGLLFHYFESKEALYTELIRIGAQAPEDMLTQISAKKPLDFFECCAEKTLRFASGSEFTARMFVLMNMAYHTEGIPQRARELAVTADFYHGLAPVIERGQADGSIRAGDPLALCTAFWTALQGAIQAHAITPDLPLPKAEWIVDIIRAK